MKFDSLVKNSDSCMETFEGVAHGSHGISRGARKLTRTPKVVKKKKKMIPRLTFSIAHINLLSIVTASHFTSDFEASS